MSSSDPMVFAARAGGMSDEQLSEICHRLIDGETVDDFQQAVIDEARIRGLAVRGEIAFSDMRAHRVSAKL